MGLPLVLAASRISVTREGFDEFEAFLNSSCHRVGLAQAGCQMGNIQSAPVTEGDDVLGVVTGPRGAPEAGVWVIAETNDLPTKFDKIVVTDDQGRYAIPDLPKATYQVWTNSGSGPKAAGA